MSDVHNIISALMTDQSAQGIDLIKDTLAKRTEAAIQHFVSKFEYATKEQEAVKEPKEEETPNGDGA